jgi:lactoylglutathione lyase
MDRTQPPAAVTEGSQDAAQPQPLPATGLFETHLAVDNLDLAIDFYGRVLGFRLAHVIPSRQAAFLWIGAEGNAMLGLWSTGFAPQTVTLHTAFRVSVADAMAAPRALRSLGVTPLDFDGRPTDAPVVLGWMPAAAVYFRDPFGHLLEYIAMLPDRARPDAGVVSWRMWTLMQNAALESR